VNHPLELGRVDRFHSPVPDRVHLASPSDNFGEVVAREQDAATVRAIPNGVAVEDGRGESALTTRTIERVVTIERNDALPDRLREVERLAIRAS